MAVMMKADSERFPIGNMDNFGNGWRRTVGCSRQMWLRLVE
jgi:hypothetical protein